jgi:hypothetical protein
MGAGGIGEPGALNPDVPIIAITANAFPSNADAWKLAGIKPGSTKIKSAPDFKCGSGKRKTPAALFWNCRGWFEIVVI